MIKKVALPLNAKFLRDDFLPVGNGFLHFSVARKRNQSVHMVGHEKEHVYEPVATFVPEFNGFENWGRNIRLTKLILAAGLRAHRDEENGVVADPMREGVW